MNLLRRLFNLLNWRFRTVFKALYRAGIRISAIVDGKTRKWFWFPATWILLDVVFILLASISIVTFDISFVRTKYFKLIFFDSRTTTVLFEFLTGFFNWWHIFCLVHFVIFIIILNFLIVLFWFLLVIHLFSYFQDIRINFKCKWLLPFHFYWGRHGNFLIFMI